MGRPSASEDPFRAIADPTRRRILELLEAGERTPSELATEFRSCQSTVSEHLAVLRRAGLIGYTESAGRRRYHLEDGSLREVIDWARQRDVNSA